MRGKGGGLAARTSNSKPRMWRALSEHEGGRRGGDRVNDDDEELVLEP
jgi:hypothetical protein